MDSVSLTFQLFFIYQQTYLKSTASSRIKAKGPRFIRTRANENLLYPLLFAAVRLEQAAVIPVSVARGTPLEDQTLVKVLAPHKGALVLLTKTKNDLRLFNRNWALSRDFRTPFERIVCVLYPLICCPALGLYAASTPLY